MVCRVPAGHYFMMGDNRDNSETPILGIRTRRKHCRSSLFHLDEFWQYGPHWELPVAGDGRTLKMLKKMTNRQRYGWSRGLIERQRGSVWSGFFWWASSSWADRAGFKVVPAVVEYIAIERAVQKIKNEGSTVRELQAAFERHATIDDITSISSRDLDITKEGDRIVISYAYAKKVPITDNVSLVIDFSGTTRDRQRKNIP